jgi:hypothetical protein
VGIAFSSRIKAQNIGHIISVPVIQRFLTEFERRGKVAIIEPGLSVLTPPATCFFSFTIFLISFVI